MPIRRVAIAIALLPVLAQAAERPHLELVRIVGDVRGKGMGNTSVAATADGTVFLLMSNNRIAVFDRSGKYVRSRTSPRPIRYPRYDTYLTGIGSRVFVGELHLDYPWVFDGKKGAKPGQFSNPADAATDEAGRTVVADRDNRRVQVFDRAKHDRPRFVVPIEDKPVAVAAQAGRMATMTDKGMLHLHEITPESVRALASVKLGGYSRDVCFAPSGDVLCCLHGGWAGDQLRRYRYAKGKLSLVSTLVRSWRDDWPNVFPSAVVLTPGRDRETVLFTGREERRVLAYNVTTDRITELVKGGPRPLCAVHDASGHLLVGCHWTKQDGPGVVVLRYKRGPKGYQKITPVPGTGHVSTQYDSNLLTSVLPMPDGAALVRVVGKKGWTSFRLKKVYPDGRLADWLDLGDNLFAKVKRLGPSSWSYALQHDATGHIIAALHIIGSVAKLTPAGKVVWQSGCVATGTGERIDIGNPADVAVDSRGSVWVADAQHHRLYCLDGATGRLVWQYGKRGGVDARDGHHLNRPTGVETALGADGVEYLVVGDAGNQRLIRYKLDYRRSP